jgi:hypothetical protein
MGPLQRESGERVALTAGADTRDINKPHLLTKQADKQTTAKKKKDVCVQRVAADWDGELPRGLHRATPTKNQTKRRKENKTQCRNSQKAPQGVGVLQRATVRRGHLLTHEVREVYQKGGKKQKGNYVAVMITEKQTNKQQQKRAEMRQLQSGKQKPHAMTQMLGRRDRLCCSKHDK